MSSLFLHTLVNWEINKLHIFSYWSNFTTATRSCCRETKPDLFLADSDNFLLCCGLEKFECCWVSDGSCIPSGLYLSYEDSSPLLTIMPKLMWEEVSGFQNSKWKDRGRERSKDQDQQEGLLASVTLPCRRKPHCHFSAGLLHILILFFTVFIVIQRILLFSVCFFSICLCIYII